MPKRRSHLSHSPAIAQAAPTYWERAQRPLQSLFFLLPLLIAYELGTVLFTPGTEIFAESILGQVFDRLGATGVYLPPLVVIAVLLGWHIARRDRWALEPRLWGGMLIESILLTIPLLVLSFVINREVAAAPAPAAALAGADQINQYSWQAKMVLSIGAGIYEELLFRLVAIAVLHMVLVDILGISNRNGALIAVVLAALAFALYHPLETYVPWRWSPGMWNDFIFYMIAGLYFAGVYVLRGFGIVVAVHAFYDVVVLSLPHIQSQ